MTKLEALAVKNGHRKTIQWMASEQFSELKQLYDRVFGDGGVYFRPTDIGVVVIVLDEDAKGYVGFRTDKYDLGYILKVGSLVPIEDELQQR